MKLTRNDLAERGKFFSQRNQNLPTIGGIDEKAILRIVFTIIEDKILPILYKIGQDMKYHEKRIKELEEKVKKFEKSFLLVKKLERPGK